MDAVDPMGRRGGGCLAGQGEHGPSPTAGVLLGCWWGSVDGVSCYRKSSRTEEMAPAYRNGPCGRGVVRLARLVMIQCAPTRAAARLERGAVTGAGRRAFEDLGFLVLSRDSGLVR